MLHVGQGPPPALRLSPVLRLYSSTQRILSITFPRRRQRPLPIDLFVGHGEPCTHGMAIKVTERSSFRPVSGAIFPRRSLNGIRRKPRRERRFRRWSRNADNLLRKLASAVTLAVGGWLGQREGALRLALRVKRRPAFVLNGNEGPQETRLFLCSGKGPGKTFGANGAPRELRQTERR